MSGQYTPKTGDRVRVVLEGEVGMIDGRLFDVGDTDGGNMIELGAKHIISVEKIADPLPTTPGSVIRLGRALFGRTQNGLWRSFNSGHTYPDTAGWSGHEVIYDAGKTA